MNEFNGLDLLCKIATGLDPSNEVNWQEQIKIGNYQYIPMILEYYEQSQNIPKLIEYYTLAFKLFPNQSEWVDKFMNFFCKKEECSDVIDYCFKFGIENANPECMYRYGNLCHFRRNYMEMKIHYINAINHRHFNSLVVLVDYYIKNEKANSNEYIGYLVKLVIWIHSKLDSDRDFEKFEKYQKILIDHFEINLDYKNIVKIYELGVEKKHIKSIVGLIQYYFNIELNNTLAEKYCLMLFSLDISNEIIKKILDYCLMDVSRYKLFEFYCFIGIKSHNLYCKEQLASYYYLKQNYINAFSCYTNIILSSKANTTQITINIDKIKEIIDIIKPLKDSILIYKQILENIKSYYEDIPNTHNMIFVEIIKLINKELGLK